MPYYPDGTDISRQFNSRNLPIRTFRNGERFETRVYDAALRVRRIDYNNGVTQTNVYNSDNTLAERTFTGAAIGDLSYQWDANKNKTSEGITGTLTGYGFTVPEDGYDGEDRLVVGWDRTQGLSQSWDLSLVGDWDSFTENGLTQDRSHGPTHELLTVAGQALQHDAKGNQTFLPSILRRSDNSLTLSWDFENKLTSADTDEDGQADVTYQWDALLRRVARTAEGETTVFAPSGQQTVADYRLGAAPATAKHTYVFGSYIDEPIIRGGEGGLRYFHRGQQYSVTALTDGGGSVVERYAYDAYGTPTITDAVGTIRSSTTENNRYLYTGREYDDSLSLYHYRARMYDSVGGRFVSRDPIGFRGSAWNLYEYVDSRPLASVDPLGLSTCASTTVEKYFLDCLKKGKGKPLVLAQCICAFSPSPSCLRDGLKCDKKKTDKAKCICYCELLNTTLPGKKKVDCNAKCN